MQVMISTDRKSHHMLFVRIVSANVRKLADQILSIWLIEFIYSSINQKLMIDPLLKSTIIIDA